MTHAEVKFINAVDTEQRVTADYSIHPVIDRTGTVDTARIGGHALLSNIETLKIGLTHTEGESITVKRSPSEIITGDLANGYHVVLLDRAADFNTLKQTL